MRCLGYGRGRVGSLSSTFSISPCLLALPLFFFFFFFSLSNHRDTYPQEAYFFRFRRGIERGMSIRGG